MWTFFFPTIINCSYIPHRQLFGQFADHAVEIVCQALELLVGWLEEVRTPPGQQPQSAPAIVWVPYNSVDVYRQKQRININGGQLRSTPTALAKQQNFKTSERTRQTHLYSSSTMLAGSACSIASAKNSSSDGMNSLKTSDYERHDQFELHTWMWLQKRAAALISEPLTCCLTCRLPCCPGSGSTVESAHR